MSKYVTQQAGVMEESISGAHLWFELCKVVLGEPMFNYQDHDKAPSRRGNLPWRRIPVLESFESGNRKDILNSTTRQHYQTTQLHDHTHIITSTQNTNKLDLR